MEAPSDTDTQKILDQMTSNQKLADQFEYIPQIKNKPRLILFNVNKTLKKEEIKTALVNQNQLLSSGSFTVDFPLKGSSGTHWVLSIDPQIYRVVEEEQGLYVGFERIRFREFISIRLCTNCGRYGHTRKVCTPERKVCLKCGKVHEEGVLVCKLSCLNCVYSNTNHKTKHSVEHACDDRENCPNYQRQHNLITRAIDYGL